MLVAPLVAIGVVELGWRDPSPGVRVDVPVPDMAEPLVERLRSAPLTGIDDARAAAIASGVVFGRTEHVTAADQEAFLASGLWHLLAASGQNIALVAACSVVLARLLGTGRTTGAVVGLVAIPAYVAVVGGGASIVRAGLMGELALVAWLAGRLADVRHLLVVVAAIICWTWPGAHRGLGMQLSFACVAALAWWAAPLTGALAERGVPRWLAAAVAATSLCSAATAPILLVRTGAAPLTGIIANVVAVPVAAALLVVGLAGSVAVVALEGPAPPWLAGLLMAPAAVLAELLVQVAHRAASLPGAQTTSTLHAVGLPACAALCAIPQLRARRAPRLLACVAGTCALVPFSAPLLEATPASRLLPGGAPPLRSGIARIAVLDVGQGDATLLASGDHALLVDTGPPDGRVVARLRELGVRRVDGIVLTHDSLDHRGGFDSAIAALRPRWVGMPHAAPGPWERVRRQAPRLATLCAGSSFDVGHLVVEVLHPPCSGRVPPRTDDSHNDAALVLLVRHGAIRALLPADAEAPVLLGLPLPRLHLLRVAHHGSEDPSLPALLERAAPSVAAISVGAGNQYGHPKRQVVDSLARAQVTMLRTDRHGSIVLDSDGATLELVG